MAHISIRVPDCEKIEMENYANFHGETLSALIRHLFREAVEDEEDMKTIENYENMKKNNELITYSHKEVGKMLGIE